MKRFTDKVVLITGAASGFGAESAAKFGAEGAKLVLADVQEDRLTGVAKGLETQGIAVATMVADVGVSANHQKLVDLALSRFGRLDVAVNNAGIGHHHMKIPQIPDDVAERVIRIDLMGVFYAMKAQIPVMEKQGSGAIVNIASAAGLCGAPLLGAYVAAKHGVVGLTKTAAVESMRKGVRVNCICPAFADTPLVREELSASKDSPEQALAKLVQAVPARRLGSAAEIVEAIMFAASPQNGFMTGQAIAIDGGLLAM